MSALLVRRRDIETDAPPAGAFRSVRYDRGLLPGAVLAPLGLYCVDTTDRVFSLTYDDGPDPASTPGVLDMLARHGARATFFVLGEPAKRHPELIRRIVDEGHELALHGMDHQSLLTHSARDARGRIREARSLVEGVAEQSVRLYRPPYGEHTLRQAWEIRRLGLELVIWSGDAVDWIDGAEEDVASRAISSIFPGAILLLHDTRADPETLRPGERLPAFDRAVVLDRILRAARHEGYEPVTVTELTTRYPLVKSLARERMSSA